MTNKSSSLKPLQDAYTAIEGCVAIVASLAMDVEKGLEHADSVNIVADFADLKQLRKSAVLTMNNNRGVIHAARRAGINLGAALPRSGLIVEASTLELGSSIALNVLTGMGESLDRLPEDPAQAADLLAELAEPCKKAITTADVGSTRRYERLTAQLQREHELAKEYFCKADDSNPPAMGWAFHPGGYSFDGVTVRLEGKQLRLLRMLVEAPGPVRVADLQDSAWEPDDAPTKGVVQAHLTRLRQHLQRNWKTGSETLILAVNRGRDAAYKFDHETFNRFARDVSRV